MSEHKVFQTPTRCPLCGEETHVERVRCGGCGSAIEGRFSVGWLSALTPAQSEFVRVFLECRGKIKDVEQALGISYPTVVSRLDDVVVALTGRPAPPRAPDEPAARGRRRKEILDSLAKGELNAEEAARLLRESSD